MVAVDLMSGNVSKAIGKIDTLAKRGGLMGAVFQGVGQSFGQMLNPLGLVTNAIGSVTGYMGDALAAAQAETAAIAKLNTAIAENDKAWGGNIQKIEDVIAARQNDYAFADGEQREALARLTSVTKDHTKALDLERQAMDLARLKSISLVDASEILGKVYGGNVGILSRYGIQLRRGASASEALAEIQKRSAGQAEAFGKTSAGASKRLELALGDLQENIGHLIEGPATAFLGFLSGIVDVIDGPSGASRNIRDLSGELLLLRANVDALVKQSPFERLTADLQAWDDTLKLQLTGDNTAERWVQSLGSDTLRLFGKASAETLADVKGLAQGVIDAGGDFGEFAAIVRRKVAPSFNVLTSTWGTTMQSIEDATAETAKNVPGIAWNIPMGIVEKLREGIPSVRSVMKDLRWAIEHPLALTRNRAKILGALTGERLKEGINSKNPAIRQAAIDARAALLTQWNALPAKAMELGRLTIKELIRGLNEGEQYALGLYGQTGTSSGDAQVAKNQRRKGKGNKRRAGGGHLMGGESYIVGENGPEELYLSAGRGGYVTPNHQMSGGGSVHFHFHGLVTSPSEADLDRIARKLAPGLRRVQARAGA